MNIPTNPRRPSASTKTGHAISIVTGGTKYCKDDTRATLRVRLKRSITKNDKINTTTQRQTIEKTNSSVQSAANPSTQEAIGTRQITVIKSCQNNDGIIGSISVIQAVPHRSIMVIVVRLIVAIDSNRYMTGGVTENFASPQTKTATPTNSTKTSSH
jgi:hypothetical protein